MADLGTNAKFSFMFGKWVEVESSNVAEIAYDQEYKVLYIGFHGGKPWEGIDYYAYPGVSWDMAWDLATADSKGKWCWDHLRGRQGGHLWPYYLVEKNKQVKRRRGKR